MKKLLLLTIIAAALVSCKKNGGETPPPPPTYRFITNDFTGVYQSVDYDTTFHLAFYPNWMDSVHNISIDIVLNELVDGGAPQKYEAKEYSNGHSEMTLRLITGYSDVYGYTFGDTHGYVLYNIVRNSADEVVQFKAVKGGSNNVVTFNRL